MRILITGGRGQLGRELQVAFASQTVLATDEPELDVTDAAVVGRAVDAFRPELIIHAAAYTDTRGCENDPGLAMRVNGDGTQNVALACRRVDAALVYVSTNEVFDGAKGEPYLESDEPRAINAYGSSKLAGELPMVTDEVSSPTWVRDLAQAIARLVERDPPAGIYHLTNEGHCSRFEWAERVLALDGRQDVVLQPITLGAYYARDPKSVRKPPFSALANTAADALGVILRPWTEALGEYFGTAPAAGSARTLH
jgi:dTDP-4-dehydrorhamnose reductase